ncbi:MAG: peptidoglycan-binding protein [Pseudomonadota bacterium]
MHLIKRGMRGEEVSLNQVRLNVRNPVSAEIAMDGIFGPRTEAATKTFQRARHLSPDGIIGPLTRAQLYTPVLRETIHQIALIPQPTNTTCWAAATAMMTRSNVPAVIARTPPDMIGSSGGLLNSSGSDQAIVTGTRYGNAHGLRCHAPMSWPADAFAGKIQRSPLMLDMLWRTNEYAAGNASPGHMVVVAGVISASGAETTFVKILDPWPPNTGKISWKRYGPWMRDVPTRTYRVFER